MERNWLKQGRNGRNGNSLPVADSTTNPGDFPVGSLESRAAARALIEQRKQASPLLQVIIHQVGGGRETGEKITHDDGTTRIIEVVYA